MNKIPLRVLLVEDDEDDFFITRRLLDEVAMFDIETCWAATFAAAQRAILEKTFDVCLVDYHLGAHNGLEFLREATAADFSAPIILLTGLDDHAVDLEAMNAGAADYIIKGKMEAATLERSIRYAIERRRAEDALEEAARRERAMIGNALDIICTIDAERRFVTINPACFKMLGYHPEELIGRPYIELLVREDLGKTNDVAQRILFGETVNNFENRYHHKNGSIVNLVWTAYWSESERLMFAVAHDITVRKQVEADLQESEIRYRRLFEGNPNPTWIWEAETLKFLAVNEEATHLLGYSREEFEKLTTEDLRPPEDLSVFYEYLAQAEAGVEKFQSMRLRKKDGTIIEVEITLQTINFAGKRARLALITDVTERKRAEKQLQESQQLLKLMIDTLPQAIWWKDSEGVYKGANRFIATVAGFDTPEQMIGLNDYDMPWTKEEADSYRAVDRRVMETGAAELDMIETQLQHDGRAATVTTNKVPLRDAGGEIVGVLGTFADITDRRRAEAALRESEYKLRTLLESMREGILQVDDDDRVIFVNDCFCEMVDYTPEELMGTDWTRLVYDCDGCHLIEQANARRREGLSDSYELCLKKKSGEMLWVIVGGAPILDAEGQITGSMGVFTDITKRKLAEEQLLHDAFHDGLTRLANRTLFNDHLQKTIERTKRDHGNMFAVLFLDFDRFKVINDSLGHTEGDNLLKQIARRLESSLRAGDLVARLGGDEFTILVNNIDEASAAMRVADRIQKRLQAPFDICGGEVFISASIGIALSSSGHEKAEDMLRDADIAMYRAKAGGRAQHQVFDRAMHEHASKQLRLETEMRQALEREEFLLHYQPIFNLELKKLVGFEALVRWRHTERGMIPPLDFIPAAEDNGLILPLGNWILHESCRQLKLWQLNNPAAAPLTISVNLSSKQFIQPDLAEQVTAALESAELNPHRLKLEITESHIMENSETGIKTLNKLRALGVELSLDDFGTGYSSLSYLHRLPVSYLKIDRSFINRMIESSENAEIVHTIIRLAQNLKMKVVAEGIETDEQITHLKSLSCEFGQGYFFAKPMEAAVAEAYIVKNLETTA